MGTLTNLEEAVAAAIAAQFPESQGLLSAQLSTASVTSRDFTGTGFFTEFTVDRSLAPAPLVVGPVGWIKSLVGPDQYSMEFMLYVRAGYAEMIEAYSYGDGYGDLDLLTAQFTTPVQVDGQTL